jgi:hypothetical protein
LADAIDRSGVGQGIGHALLGLGGERGLRPRALTAIDGKRRQLILRDELSRLSILERRGLFDRDDDFDLDGDAAG